MRRCSKRPNKKHFTRSEMAGLFFCLASVEGAGLLFCPAAIQPNTSVYNAFYTINTVIPPIPQNNAQGFTGAFPAICLVLPPLCGGVSCYTAPPVTRWSVSQRRSISSAYHRYNRHAGRCTAQHSRPIIIMYIRVRRCYGSTPDSAAYHRPCQPGGVIPAACDLAPGQQSGRTGWHPLPGGQSSNRGAAGGAEPLAALAVSLFGLSPDS